MGMLWQHLNGHATLINIIYQPKVLDESGMSIEMLPEHTHAVVLTDNELILIKEDNHKYKNIHSNYGVIRDFIPLAHIRNVMTESQQTGVRMHVNIEDRDEVDRVFEQTQSERLANLIQKFKSLMH
jgi:hypothetical protein